MRPLVLALMLLSWGCTQERDPPRGGGPATGTTVGGAAGLPVTPPEETEQPAGDIDVMVREANYRGLLRSDRAVEVTGGEVSFITTPGSSMLTATDESGGVESMLIIQVPVDLSALDAPPQLEAMNLTACSGDGDGYDWEESSPADVVVEQEPDDDPDKPRRFHFSFSGRFPDGFSDVDGSFIVELQ